MLCYTILNAVQDRLPGRHAVLAEHLLLHLAQHPGALLVGDVRQVRGVLRVQQEHGVVEPDRWNRCPRPQPEPQITSSEQCKID